MITIPQLAEQAHAMLETRTRDSGSTFWTFKDGRPEWMHDLAHFAHGDMMPDDYRYAVIAETLERIADARAVYAARLAELEG